MISETKNMLENEETTPIIRIYQDVVAYDGKIANVIGKYTAVSKPVKGIAHADREKNYAVIILADGTQVFLESLDTPQVIRPVAETEKFDGMLVRVQGTIHNIMPSTGQSVINPCISHVISIFGCERIETKK